jgi:hypothetical protein
MKKNEVETESGAKAEELLKIQRFIMTSSINLVNYP